MTSTPTYKVPTRDLWNTMPGWGIAADLTPPELLESRKLRATTRQVLIGLAAVVGLVVLGYAFAFAKHMTASGHLKSANSAASQLTQEQHKYDNVVQIQGTIAQVQTKLRSLMSNDTDVSGLLNHLADATPPGVAITDVTITLNPPGIKGGTPGGVSLDTSGKQTIGTLTIDGSGTKITDAAAYTHKLQSLPGLINVYLGSNTQDTAGTTYSIKAAVTADLLTHRYATASDSAAAPQKVGH